MDSEDPGRNTSLKFGRLLLGLSGEGEKSSLASVNLERSNNRAVAPFRALPRLNKLRREPLSAAIPSNAIRKKPLLHQIITDVIIFAPVLAIPAAIIDLAMHPPHGWQQGLTFALTASLFTLVGCK